MLSSFSFVTTALTINSVIPIPSSGTIGHITTLSLHVEGKYIKDDLGNIIVLRGVGHWKFHLDPTGWFQPEGGSWMDGNRVWNEANVRYHLQTMKNWGFNCLRIHTPADWWIQDNVSLGTFTGSFRQIIKELIAWAADYGIYIIFEHYSPINFDTYLNHGVGIPYAPYCDDPTLATVFPSGNAFAEYWGSVAEGLKAYPNVIFELHNEPHTLGTTQPLEEVRNSWFNTMQLCVDAIRSTGAEQPVVLGWGIAVPDWNCGWSGSQDYGGCSTMHFINHTGVSDPLNNLIYTGHTYVEYIPWASEYDTLKAQMQDVGFEYAASKVPVFVGEFGVNQWQPNATLQDHLLWAENFIKICNEWGIGYLGWNWSVLGGEDTAAGWALISNEDAIISGPTQWGQVLIDGVAEGGTLEPSP